MVRKINESNNKDYCKYVVDEIFSTYYNRNPQYDILDEAIDIISEYITDSEYDYIEEQGFTKESIFKVLSRKSNKVISKIENELAKIKFIGFVKYADRDAYNEYENSLLK